MNIDLLTKIATSPYLPRLVKALVLKHIWVPRAAKLYVKRVSQLSEQGLYFFMSQYNDAEPWMRQMIRNLVFNEITYRNAIRRINEPMGV